jgi:hypothetical protein
MCDTFVYNIIDQGKEYRSQCPPPTVAPQQLPNVANGYHFHHYLFWTADTEIDVNYQRSQRVEIGVGLKLGTYDAQTKDR